MSMSAKPLTDIFFSFSNDLLCIIGFDGTFHHVNPAWQATLGHPPDTLLSKPVLHFVDPEDQRNTEEYFRAVRQKPHVKRIQNRFINAEGNYHWLSWNAFADAEQQLIYAIARDIDKRKAKERRLSQLADIVEHSMDAIISHTAKGIIISWNKGAEQIYGYTADEMIGKYVLQLFPEQQKNELNQIIRQVELGNPVQQFETTHQTKDHSLIAMSLTYAPVLSSSNALIGVSCIGRDITHQKQIWEELQLHRKELDLLVELRTQELAETNVKLYKEIEDRKRAEEQLRLLSHKDALTNLFNRRRFFELLESEYNRAKRYGLALSLLVIDIDFFKSINDTYGHSAGDDVLKSFSALGLSLFRSVDVFARTGGEEFIVLLPETGLPGAKDVAERFRCAVENLQIDAGENYIHITISTGIITMTKQIRSIEELITKGDKALYAAKKAGRNRWLVYDESMD